MKTKILSFSIAILQITISLILIYGLYISLSLFLNVLTNSIFGYKYSDISFFKIFKNYIIKFTICLIGLIGGILILFKQKIGDILSLTFWLSFLFLGFFTIFELYKRGNKEPIETKQAIYYLALIILKLFFISFYIFKNKFSKKDYIFPISFLAFSIIINLI
jgi:hypothetical protein